MNELLFRFTYEMFSGSAAGRASAVFFSNYIGWVTLIVIILGFWVAGIFNRRTGRIFLLALTSGLVAWLLVAIIKLIYPTPRPLAVLADISALVSVGSAAAFPSGHAAFFMAVAESFPSQFFNRWRWFLIIGALLTGLGRVAAGVHWPGDVLAGWLLGAVAAKVIRVLVESSGVRTRLPV